MIASSTVLPVPSRTTRRMPFTIGLIAGTVGTRAAPLSFSRSSPPGEPIRRSPSFDLLMMNGVTALHGSQASPMSSPSPSACVGLLTSGQLSAGPQKPSPSLSPLTSAGQLMLVPVQLSAGSHEPVELRQIVPDGANPSAGQALDEPVQLS